MSEPHLSLLQFRGSPPTKAVNRGERKKEVEFALVKLFLILGRISREGPSLRTLLFWNKAAIELGSHLAWKLKSE